MGERFSKKYWTSPFIKMMLKVNEEHLSQIYAFRTEVVALGNLTNINCDRKALIIELFLYGIINSKIILIYFRKTYAFGRQFKGVPNHAAGNRA